MRRSLILDVVVRAEFHALLVVALYLLFAGHNSPGGGFAGGLVAGSALALRFETLAPGPDFAARRPEAEAAPLPRPARWRPRIPSRPFRYSASPGPALLPR